MNPPHHNTTTLQPSAVQPKALRTQHTKQPSHHLLAEFGRGFFVAFSIFAFLALCVPLGANCQRSSSQRLPRDRHHLHKRGAVRVRVWLSARTVFLKTHTRYTLEKNTFSRRLGPRNRFFPFHLSDLHVFSNFFQLCCVKHAGMFTFSIQSGEVVNASSAAE